ncbi:hypothetical protein B5X24_HaOG216492 [Helicoverpa armigera]|nr:hypothetical protein B5X24_HaOG216492 [Helicoverpa armigera]
MSSVRYVSGGAVALGEDSSEEEGSVEQALSLRDVGAPARVLHALNALRNWRPGPALRKPRAALGLAVLEDVLYAVGGFDGKEFLSCVECLYEPDGEWTTLLAPPAPRAALTPDTPGDKPDKPPELVNGPPAVPELANGPAELANGSAESE